MQRTNQIKMCRVHFSQKGEYYIASEPWNKLCKQCALNRALCGYNIQQDLTPQQFQNKIILGSLTQQIKAIILNTEKYEKQYGALAQRINTLYSVMVAPTLKQIDSHIEGLNKIRDQISKLYQANISNRIVQFHEYQSNCFMQAMQFKKYLQNLQANYCDIITDIKDNNGEQLFPKQVNFIRLQIQKSRKVHAIYDKIKIEQTLKAITQEFQKIFQQFHLKAEFKPKLKPPKLSQKQINQQDQNKNKNILQNSQNKLQTQTQSKKKLTITEHMQSPFLSNRKRPCADTKQQNKNSILTSANQLTQRTPSLTLKSYKRNSSVNSKNKNNLYNFELKVA